MGEGEKNRGWAVKAFFDVQTPLQIRNLTPLTVGHDDDDKEPSRSPVFIPGCSRGAGLLCPVKDFVGLVRRSVRGECVTPPALREFVVDGLDFDPTAIAIGAFRSWCIRLSG